MVWSSMPSRRSYAHAVCLLFQVAIASVAYSVFALPADAKKPAKASRDASVPLTVVVDLSRQRLQAYRGVNRVWSSRISSGKRGHRTPTGVFSIIQKRRRHFSNLYNNAPMPHMQRLTWSGIAFHGGPIPGYPASHGCVRLPYANARNLFRMTRAQSTRVVVTYGSPKPSAISHAILPNRLPETAPADSRTLPVAATDPIGSRSTTRLMNSVIGVSSAMAAADNRLSALDDGADLPPARSRTEARARLEAMIERRRRIYEQRQAAIGNLRASVRNRAATLKSLNMALRKTERARTIAQRRLSKLERSSKRVTQRMRRLISANLDVDEISIAQLSRLEASETKYEERLASLVGERALLRGELRDLDGAMAALEPAAAVARADYKVARRALAAAGEAAKTAKAALETSEHRLKRYDQTVHILISRTKSKIFFRQGYKDIFKADVTFSEPDTPIGTHVFKAIREAGDRETLRWTALTVPDRKYAKRVRRAKNGVSRKQRKSRRVAYQRFSARSALDRVTIPQDARQMMRELVKVGSSIIVSDRGPSIETGKGTDFIVLTR